ncbi:unnamed protein product [Darwinula stevensoni]|uniref:Uncharacterized protein n=1 Tax=Darwinula stevensoni TaxID=69355 RepID=A0A7R9AFY3_9CRUS|nr:unnamed protein product [Darwinula stevensoni]CAG0903441.1 unnamed protein product [Darwinula stevensoni]
MRLNRLSDKAEENEECGAATTLLKRLNHVGEPRDRGACDAMKNNPMTFFLEYLRKELAEPPKDDATTLLKRLNHVGELGGRGANDAMRNNPKTFLMEWQRKELAEPPKDDAAEDDARICCGVEMSSREGHFQVYKLQPLFPFTQQPHRRKQLTCTLCELLSRRKVSFFQWEKKMKVQLATTILATMLILAALWESVDAGGCEESKNRLD